MGFNKKIIPKESELNKIYNMDSDSYIKNIIKTDALIGSTDSIEWINNKVKDYYDKRKSTK